MKGPRASFSGGFPDPFPCIALQKVNSSFSFSTAELTFLTVHVLIEFLDLRSAGISTYALVMTFYSPLCPTRRLIPARLNGSKLTICSQPGDRLGWHCSRVPLDSSVKTGGNWISGQFARGFHCAVTFQEHPALEE